VKRGVQLYHEAFEYVALDIRARKPVEQKTVGVRMLGYGFLDYLHDYLVRYESARRDDALGLEAKLAFGRKLLAEQVSRGYVKKIIFLN